MSSSVFGAGPRVMTVMLLLTGCPLAAQALDLHNVLTGYTVTGWREQDGVRLGPVTALARTADGYLWIAADGGLVRFDGARLTRWRPVAGDDLPAAPVTALHVTAGRDLWVGFSGGAGIRLVRDGRVIQPGTGTRPTGTITAFSSDTAGTIWAGGSSGVFAFDGRGWRPMALDGRVVGTIHALHAASDGVLWIAAETGLYRRDPDGSVHTIVRDRVVRDVTEDSLHRVWVTDPESGVRPLNGRWNASPHQGQGNELLHDSQGNLWVATLGQGLWRVQYDGMGPPVIETISVATGLLGDGVGSILEDERGLWVGTGTGLTLLAPYRVMPVLNIGLARWVEVADANSVWVATAAGLLRLTGGTSPTAIERHLPGLNVRVAHRDDHGTTWLVTSRGVGRLVRGEFVAVAGAASVAPDRFSSLASDTHGQLWVAHRDAGLFLIQDLTLVPFVPPQQRLPRDVLLLHPDAQGLIWMIAERGRSLAALAGNGTIRTFSEADGLTLAGQASITAVANGRDGAVWFGTDAGLIRYRHGAFAYLTPQQGLPAQAITAVAEDAAGMLWLGMARGLLRLDPADADEVFRGRRSTIRYTLLDQADGVAGVVVRREPPARGTRSPDGVLWFATGRGLTAVDPAAIAAAYPQHSGSVEIESVTAGSHRYDPVRRAALPSNVERLQIDYTALKVPWPNAMRFRYRLRGVDTAWVDAGIERRATYTNLKTGNYRFEVVARSEKDTGIELATTWEFSVSPAFYQTKVFFATLAGVLALSIWTAWHVRLRQVRRQFALILAERARLGREIHDTLLQGLVGVALQIGDAEVEAEQSPISVRTHLSRIRKRVEQYAAEASQTIWNLRSPFLESMDLVGALKRILAETVAGTDVRTEFTVAGDALPLPDRVQHELLRIAQEAITNSVRHARASYIGLQLRFEASCIVVKVSDDGIGFDPEMPSPDRNHFGLMIMRERAQEAGGEISIASQSGRGTHIQVHIPLSRSRAGRSHAVAGR